MKLCITIVLFSLVLVGCGTNVMGRSALQIMPDSVITEMGVQAYTEQKESLAVSKNETHKALVNQVAERLIAQCKVMHPEEVKDFAWEVNLFDDDATPNAYALPGGKIGVYTGILPVCETEAGLAFVLAHEVGHAVLGHGNERTSQELIANGALQGAELAMASSTGIFQQHKDIVLKGLGMGVKVGALLPFSRSHESESDHFGIMLMAAAGYDPHAAPTLWVNMNKLGSSDTPEYLSTHPANDTRIAELQALIPEAMKIYEKAPNKYGMGAATK